MIRHSAHIFSIYCSRYLRQDCLRPIIVLTVQTRGLKHQSFIRYIRIYPMDLHTTQNRSIASISALGSRSWTSADDVHVGFALMSSWNQNGGQAENCTWMWS